MNILSLLVLLYCGNLFIKSQTSESYSSVEIQNTKAISPGNIDLVFCVDNTGSMGSEVSTVQIYLKGIIALIKALPLASGSVKIGVVAYRDYSDSWVIKKQDLTDNYDLASDVVNQMVASGGGDFPEAAAEAFFVIARMNWRLDSSRMVVWIADAPPHDAKSGFLRWEPQIDNLQEMGIIVHSVLVRSDTSALAVMNSVGKTTGGLVCTLQNSAYLVSIITGVAEDSLDRLRINYYVKKEIDDTYKDLQTSYPTEEARIRKITDNLRAKSIKKRRMSLSSNGTVYQSFSPIQVKDIRDGIAFLNINPKLNPCSNYGVLCQCQLLDVPEIGLVSNKSMVSLPLKSVDISAKVIDSAAEVSVNQTYTNDASETITGTYTFPLPDGAAVTSFVAYVDGKKVEGKVYDITTATNIYNYNVAIGNGAYLLTQEANNIFKMSVGNITPGLTVTISLVYICNLSGDDSNLLFTLPSNISPKFDLRPADSPTSPTVPTYIVSFKFVVDVVPQITSCASLTTNYACAVVNNQYVISESSIPRDKDYIVSISYNKTSSSDKIFLEDRPSNSNITEYASLIVAHPKLSNATSLTSLDQVFVLVDVSSSVSNNVVFSTIKSVVVSLLNSLPSSISKFYLGTFANDYVGLINGVKWSDTVRLDAIKLMDSIVAFGGTNLSQINSIVPNYSFSQDVVRVFVVTDGNFAAAQYAIDSFTANGSFVDLRILPIGVGYITSSEWINKLSMSTLTLYESVYPGSTDYSSKVAKQVSRALLPAYNYNISTSAKMAKLLPSVFDGTRLVLYGLWSTNDLTSLKNEQINVSVSTKNGQFLEKLSFSLANPTQVISNSLLVHKLAAKNYIKELEINGSIYYNEIVKYGVLYNLTSKYTAFVAVEERNTSNQITQCPNCAYNNSSPSTSTSSVSYGSNSTSGPSYASGSSYGSNSTSGPYLSGSTSNMSVNGSSSGGMSATYNSTSSSDSGKSMFSSSDYIHLVYMILLVVSTLLI